MACIFRGDEKSGRKENPPSTAAAPAVSSSRDSPARSNVRSAGSRGNAGAKKPRTPNAQSAGTSTSGGSTTNQKAPARHLTQPEQEVMEKALRRSVEIVGKPLTPAEKQKAYREKGGDKLREANRLRMAVRRKE